MSIAAFEIAATRLYTPLSKSDPFFANAMTADAMSDRRMSSANEGMFVPTTLILRKLPWNTTNEAVRTMLLFAKDLQETELVPNEYQEDKGFVTAAAHFSTVTGASEAQTMLDGKPNTAGQANMIVEIVSNASRINGRRNTIDPASARSLPQPMSSPPPQAPKSSRFNDTFQSLEKMSPPPIGSPPEHLIADGKSHIHGMLSPQSPKQSRERSRVPARSVIEDDTVDDETGELLKDSMAYLKNENAGFSPVSRQLSNPRLPIAAFNSLSLNTNMNAIAPANYASPRSAVHAHAPNGGFSSTGHGYQGGNQYLRHNYPPVNPADQNPPCNTLYVGNLPMDTSEDELKAMFSKQRGYKRLCFRTKQNGPMCFVEFEDISFATKALNELYGAQLHNSVKGGIRLSFSKNPLGVRSGQPGGTNPSTPLSPGVGMINNITPLSPGGFSTANGPPPGLSAPPGLAMSGAMSPPLQNGQYAHQGFPHAMSPIHGNRSTPLGNTSNSSHSNTMYPDYMMGR